jgi:hypothetical protein
MKLTDKTNWLAVIVMPLLLAGAVAYLLVFFGILSFGASAEPAPQDEGPPRFVPTFSPQDVQQVMDEQVPAYWVGEEYKGLRLLRILPQRVAPPPGTGGAPTNAVELVYGDCVVPHDYPTDLPPCPTP